LLSTVMAHRGGVNAVRYLKGAQSIVSAGADGTLKLWSRDGEPQGELTPPERLQFAPATFLDVDSDGKTIWAMQGNRLVAYDVTTKQGTLDDVWLPIVQRVREEVRKEKPAPLPVSLPYIWTARRNTMLIAHDTLNGKWVGEYNRLGELLGSPHIIRESPRQLGYFADGRILCVTGDGFQSFPSSLNPMSPVTAASSDAERWTWPGQWPKDPQLLTGEGNHVRRVQLR